MDACEAALKVLIVSPRCPWTGHTGDRLRVRIWIEALAKSAEVVLIAPDRGAAQPPAISYVPARWSAARLMSDGIRIVAKSLPVQSLLTAGFAWQRLVDEAIEKYGPFDASIVVLSRLHVWLDAPPAARIRILDAIDSLMLSMRERAREASGPARPFWKREERLTAVLEGTVGAMYDRVLVVNDDEKELFGPNVDVISNGVRIEPEGSGERSFDCGFWGRLRYFANRDAAAALAEEIWPDVRRRHPAARLVIAGAEAPASIRRLNGRDGITVISPVADMAKLAREVKVALFPVRYGTGQANKVLEAAEGGCAIVGTPEAIRGLSALAPGCRTSGSFDDLARFAADLLDDPAARDRHGSAVRKAAAAHYSRDETMRQMRKVVGVPGA